MIIQYMSDLHLEFGNNSVYLKSQLRAAGDILLICGDVGYIGDEQLKKHPFWDWASENFKDVIIIPGNHDLYCNFNLNALEDDSEIRIRDNVRFVYNKLIHLTPETDLIATTLWSNIPDEYAEQILSRMADFKKIKIGDNLLTIARYNIEHDKCQKFLLKSIRESKANNIIVASHHVPSTELIPKDFNKEKYIVAFASDTAAYITDQRVKYWIYGHSHSNINKNIGYVQYLTNQLGYVRYNEHCQFQVESVVEIP